MEKFVPHFDIEEFFRGCTTYERQSCPRSSLASIFKLCQMLTIIRDAVNQPLIINSGFRDYAHNLRVGGVKTSQHLKGEAVDFRPKDLDLLDVICNFIVDNLEFGQLIKYPTFIHLSLPRKNKPNNQYIKK